MEDEKIHEEIQRKLSINDDVIDEIMFGSNYSPTPFETLVMSTTTIVNCYSSEAMDNCMDCFADDREALNDFAKYFNNSHLSDVTLIVGDETYPSHRIILTKSSEVFERMLSQKWNGNNKREIELVEESQCVKAFAAFLRFLYCNHVCLHSENTLSILILADKYNVNSLRKVCIDYAISQILPSLSLKDLFHIWFHYGTKAYHQQLIAACIAKLSRHFFEMIASDDWSKEWLSLDRDQLIELLKSNELQLPNEYLLWEAVVRWLQAPSHPERRGNTAAPLIAQILPLIRFPFMTADELSHLETLTTVENHSKLFQPQILLAYKFQALPLASRIGCKEFMGTQFLLRNYTDIRWDKRVTIDELPLTDRYTEFSFKFQTRSSTVPVQPWDWELKVHPKGFSSANEDFHVILSSNCILDQSRSIEYLLSIVDDRKVVRSVAGKKNFTKTRYSSDLEIDKRVGMEELLGDNSPLLVNGSLHLQLTLRPID